MVSYLVVVGTGHDAHVTGLSWGVPYYLGLPVPTYFL